MRLANPSKAPWWTQERLRRTRTAALLFLIWTAVGLFQSAPDVLKGAHWTALLAKLIEVWVWVLITPAILLVDRILTSAPQNGLRLCLGHLAMSVPFSLAQTYLSGLIEYPITEIWWSPIRDQSYVVYYFLGGWTTYVAFVGVLQALKFYNGFMTSQVELERIEKRLVESNLNALRSQLEPHFLFNALNAISSQVVANPEVSREMIDDLAVLLRRSLDCQGRAEIKLAEELALLDHYIAIQKLRFGDWIEIRVDADPDALQAMVPSMLLQPMVENAIRHGLEKRMSGGMVAVNASLAGRHLQITVFDDGVGLPPRWSMETCSGHGVRVTRERLEALYGTSGDYGFTMSRRQGGGTEVVIRIPLPGNGA